MDNFYRDENIDVRAQDILLEFIMMNIHVLYAIMEDVIILEDIII